MNRKAYILAGAIGAMGIGSLLAFGPNTPDTGYVGAGASVRNTHKTLLGTAGTEEILDAAASTDACFPWDSKITITAIDGEVSCCWTQDPDTTIGAYASETAFTIATATITGDCAGFTVAENETHVERASFKRITRSPGAQIGLCTGALTQFGVTVLQPCIWDGDCTTGTCDTSPASGVRQAQGCGYLLCQPSANNTYVTSRVER